MSKVIYEHIKTGTLKRIESGSPQVFYFAKNKEWKEKKDEIKKETNKNEKGVK